MGSDLLSRTEQLVDVAVAITDMHAPGRIVEERRGLPQVVQPPKAFLALDRERERERDGVLEIRCRRDCKLTYEPRSDRDDEGET